MKSYKEKTRRGILDEGLCIIRAKRGKNPRGLQKLEHFHRLLRKWGVVAEGTPEWKELKDGIKPVTLHVTKEEYKLSTSRLFRFYRFSGLPP